MDFVSEVSEEYRRDQMLRAAKRYGGIAVALVVVALGVAGFWAYREAQKRHTAENAGVRLDAALASLQADSALSMDAIQKKLQPTDASPLLELLALQREAVVAPEKAIAGFEAFAANTKHADVWRDYAKLRAAWIGFETLPLSRVDALLRPLTLGTNPWRHSARELLLLKLTLEPTPDTAAIASLRTLLETDPQTPSALRQRLNAL
jgi:hypothetical protein